MVRKFLSGIILLATTKKGKQNILKIHKVRGETDEVFAYVIFVLYSGDNESIRYHRMLCKEASIFQLHCIEFTHNAQLFATIILHLARQNKRLKYLSTH